MRTESTLDLAHLSKTLDDFPLAFPSSHRFPNHDLPSLYTSIAFSNPAYLDPQSDIRTTLYSSSNTNFDGFLPSVWLNMCSDCDSEHEFPHFICQVCGTYCEGLCQDPDTCPTCWHWKNDPTAMVDDVDTDIQSFCIDEDRCLCTCHDDVYEDMGMRYKHGAWFDDEEDPVFVRKGVFPFLKLPGELRDRIYGFAFLQDGCQRKTAKLLIAVQFTPLCSVPAVRSTKKRAACPCLSTDSTSAPRSTPSTIWASCSLLFIST